MKTTIMILFGFSVLVGCTKEGVSTNSTNNSQIKVDELFTNNNCTVYRFEDGGRKHYYTNCTETISSHTKTIQDNNRTN